MAVKKRKSAPQRSAGVKKPKVATNASESRIPRQEENLLARLLNALNVHQNKVLSEKGNVVHWFRSDLRLQDNRALHAASQKAQENGKGLIALYIMSPQAGWRRRVVSYE